MEIRVLPLATITIPPSRQRKDFGDIPALAASIQQNGLIQPIVVVPDNTSAFRFELVAGERRLQAHKHLGWPTIEAVELGSLPEPERVLIELEENLRRKDLTWPEHVFAIQRYASLRRGDTDAAIANALGIGFSALSQILRVAEALPKRPELKEMSSWYSAYRLLVNDQNRELSSIVENMGHEEPEAAPRPTLSIEADSRHDIDTGSQRSFSFTLASEKSPTLQPARSNGIIGPKDIAEAAAGAAAVAAAGILAPVSGASSGVVVADFALWARYYNGPRFNLIHCDFPYGTNIHSNDLQNSSAKWAVQDKLYEDTPETFERLCRAFFEYQSNFIADSAHCIFWVAHKNYGAIASRFKYFGWDVSEVPLIWHKSDSKGLAPVPDMWPRRTYEIAIFASKGGRKLVRLDNASCSFPTSGLEKQHISEKPSLMLEHFLSMICDRFSEVLDPTCGSGTALEVAKSLDAKRILGLDIEEKWVRVSKERLKIWPA